LTERSEATNSGKRNDSWLRTAAAAVAVQCLIIGLCVAARVRVAWLVGAHTSPIPYSTPMALVDALVPWAALALTFGALLPGRCSPDPQTPASDCLPRWAAALWYSGIARISVVPVVVFASHWALGQPLSAVEIRPDQAPPLDLSAWGAGAWIMLGLCLAAIIAAIYAHGVAFQKAACTSRPPVGRFLAAFVLAAALAHFATSLINRRLV